MISDQDKQRITSKSEDLYWAGIIMNRTDFIVGAKSEHPIAYNKALEDVINILIQNGPAAYSRVLLMEELQKMRK